MISRYRLFQKSMFLCDIEIQHLKFTVFVSIGGSTISQFYIVDPNSINHTHITPLAHLQVSNQTNTQKWVSFNPLVWNFSESIHSNIQTKISDFVRGLVIKND